ncbi:MAG: amino acid adenylation domain-containing protein, partial [Cyanobacteria bacterium P01_F01_bin.143]
MQKEQLEGFRLSPQQKHLWTLQQGKSLSPYRVQYAVQITGNLNLEVLETVLQSIVNQHEILRTNFNCLPGMSLPLQVIAETYDISLDKFDLVGVSHEEQQDKIAALFTELKAKAFSLENSPPLYAYLVTLSSTKYILMLSLSALIADSFTIDKLFNKIDSFYTAYLKNKTILDEPMQYADIAEWQNEILSSEDSELGKEYWQKQGGILTDNLKLWSEKKPSIASEFQPQYVCFEINNSFIKNIAPLAEQYEVDKSDFFLACWLILLGKITRQSDIVLGVIGDGRQYEELESALGPLAKHLPLACHVEAEFKYSEIVQQIHQSLNEAYEWQEYFTYQDSESACPFSFEFAEYPEQPFAENLLLSWYQQYSCIDRFKIKLSCINTEDSLITQIYFDSRLYERQDVEILAEQFQSLLASALENPETAIGQLNILSDRDKQKLLVEFNNTQTQYPQDKTIHQLFEEQVNRAPNEIAVVFEEQQLTYSELNTRANQLANYLQSQGVKPDALVGIYLERSLEMIIALLGVLKSGGAYIPLDPTLPQEGLVSRVEDAQVPVILTQESLVSKLAEIKTAAITVDTNWEVIAQQSKSDNLVNRVTSQNLAYVLFTSGSTGKPKGVAVEHRQLTNYINAIEDRLNLAVCDNLALVSTFAADLGNTVIFPALCNGGCLHVISSEAATNPEILANYFQDHSIDCLKIVPSHLSVLLKSPQAKNILPKKRLILGGEACSWKLIAQIQQLAPECLVFNHYGPTETTVGVLTYPIKLEQASDYSGTVPLGHPLANTQIYILDDLLQPVPIGVPGELFIGGHGVAREYLNRPSLTNEKFISSPFGATDQNHGDHRIYKTGDLARYLPDGNIEFLGRIDNQVKIRGFRIELGEIETTISQHPAVLETVVVAREESPNLKRLVAYIVAQPESALTISALREFLEAKLPGYMVPSAWVTLKALPLTPNGKVNRKALPTPEPSRPELEAQFVAPQTVVQKQLAEIWTEVLGVENIGINDNFFELGGDSILSLQVIYQANQKGLYLKPKQLFQHQTIARLAEVAGTTQKIQAEQGLVTGELELMPIQHYFLEQQQPEPQYYNQAILLEIKQEINPVDLEKIIDSLQKHHDLLRLRFIREEASTQALISAPTAEIPLTCYDFSLLPPAQQTSAIEETANKLQASLNLTQGPLFQVALFDLGQERGQRLLWIIHHLAVD